MTTFIKPLFIICLMALSFVSVAQFDKVEYAIEDENYKRVEKITRGYMDDSEMKRLPETYFYHALALYELSKDEFYFAKNPDAVKRAVKAVKKGFKKDKNSSVAGEFEEMIDGLAERQNEQALSQYNINKMTKATTMFDDSYLLNGNRYAYLMSAKSAINYKDTAKCEKHYNDLIKWYNEDFDSGVSEPEMAIDPHVYFINKFWEQGKYDSAKYYISNGRKIFGLNQVKLNYYHKEVVMAQIKDMPPSNLLMEYLQEVIRYVPTDKTLLHKENAIYIYLIKNKIANNMEGEADSLISKFVREKVSRSGSEDVIKIKETDVFIEQKPENVLWKLAEYFQTYSHFESSKYVLDKYIRSTAKSDTATEIAARWNVITEYAYKTKGLSFAIFILEQAILKYPENSGLSDLRRKIIAEKEVVKTTVDEQGAVYSLMKEEYLINKNEANV